MEVNERTNAIIGGTIEANGYGSQAVKS